jgi:hypothetical protein
MDWQVVYLRSLGAPTTAQNLKFLNTWQRFEGGSTNNAATNNYLNTTYGTGYKSINSVGVKAYPDLQTGAQAFAATLTGDRRYSGIVQGLRAGDPYALKDRVAAGLSTWLSGSPTKGLGYASKVLGAAVSPVDATGTPTTAPGDPLAAPSTLVPDTVAMNLTAHLSPQQQLSALVNAVASQPKTPQPVPAAVIPSSGGGAGTVTQTGLYSVIPARYATRSGIRLSAGLVPQVEQITKQFGVRVNSGYRTAARNAEVGGAPHSDHLSGNAVDFTGTPAQMRALYDWAQGRFPYVEPWDQAHGNHVHISFKR